MNPRKSMGYKETKIMGGDKPRSIMSALRPGPNIRCALPGKSIRSLEGIDREKAINDIHRELGLEINIRSIPQRFAGTWDEEKGKQAEAEYSRLGLMIFCQYFPLEAAGRDVSGLLRDIEKKIDDILSIIKSLTKGHQK